ncbi:MAG: cytochrome c [Chloroflexota bacterium]|nr:cytochrome c [Chloroflexota bacterium]
MVVLTSREELWDEEEFEEESPPWLPVGAIIVIALLAFSPAFLGGGADETPDEVAAAPPVLAERPDTGRQLYLEACSACHGPEGEGIPGLGSPLVDTELTLESDAEEWIELVREGIPADHPANETGVPMPPSGGRPDLTDADLASILEYLRTLSGVASSR